MSGTVITFCVAGKRRGNPDAARHREDPNRLCTIIILPVVRIERFIENLSPSRDLLPEVNLQ